MPKISLLTDGSGLTLTGAELLPFVQSGVTYQGTTAQLLTIPINDVSTVIGSAAKYFNATYFGNAATGKVHRFNRVKVGVATLSSSDVTQSTPDWLETLGATFSSGGQLTSISAIGELGVVGASRTSDYHTWSGGVSGGSEGVIGFGYLDSAGAIAIGVQGVAIRNTGITDGVALNQFDACNSSTVVDATPFGGVAGGSTFSAGFTAGSFGNLASVNATAAAYIGAGSTARFRKGMIVFDGALDVALGGGGNGVAFELARNMSLRWLNSGATTDAEVWANASGLILTGAGNIKIGGADSGTPVAQTLGFQNGTGSNIAAVNTTIVAPLATGSATNGDLIFQTGVKVGSGTGAPTKTTALTIKGETQEIRMAGPSATLGTSTPVTAANFSILTTNGASGSGIYLNIGNGAAANCANILAASSGLLIRSGSLAAGAVVFCTGATGANNAVYCFNSGGIVLNQSAGATGSDPGANSVLINGANVGISTAVLSSAYLAIAIGTTAIAQINFGSTGVAPTSPNNGDFWFDGTNFKARVAGATKTFTIV